jgi:hypothetical protein
MTPVSHTCPCWHARDIVFDHRLELIAPSYHRRGSGSSIGFEALRRMEMWLRRYHQNCHWLPAGKHSSSGGTYPGGTTPRPEQRLPFWVVARSFYSAFYFEKSKRDVYLTLKELALKRVLPSCAHTVSWLLLITQSLAFVTHLS